MATRMTPRQIADQESEAARQRAAGRQRDIKKGLGDSVQRVVNGNQAKYKSETNKNWSRAAEEARMTGAARAAAIAAARKKAGK